MQRRRLGSTGLEVSRLGLGTMQWGRGVDAATAGEQLTAFLDAGGTLVDTAALYGDGRAEGLLGELVDKLGCRDDLELVSKSGLRRRGEDVVRDTSRGHLLTQLDRTLAALGTDHLDLWLVHVWDDGTPAEETFGALEHAVRTGRARYVGVSNFTAWQTSWAAAWLSARPDGVALAATQVEYSLVRRTVETDVVPAAAAHGAGLLAGSPLGRGELTGKDHAGVPGDSRAAHPEWESFVGAYLTPARQRVVEAVARAAEGLDVSPAHVALAWLRDRPQVGSALLGARTTDQLEHALASEQVDLPVEIVQALDDVSEGAR